MMAKTGMAAAEMKAPISPQVRIGTCCLVVKPNNARHPAFDRYCCSSLACGPTSSFSLEGGDCVILAKGVFVLLKRVEGVERADYCKNADLMQNL